jgi:regulator of sigma E protease
MIGILFKLAMFVLVLGPLIFVHELGHFLMARRAGVRVEKFSLGFGKKLFSFKRRDTQYCICAVPLGGYVKMAGDSAEEFSGKTDEYFAQPPWKRALIIFCGPLLNYLMGIVLFWFILTVGVPTLTTKIGGVENGFGAQEAGLQKDDRIVAVEDAPVQYWMQLQQKVSKRTNGERVNLTVRRGDSTFTVPVRIKAQYAGFGSRRSIGLIGVRQSTETEIVRYPLLKAARLSLLRAFMVTDITYRALWGVVTGQLSMRDSMTGPLGMMDITSQMAMLGLIPLLEFVGLVSVSLAVFNLLPLPVLDGGHLFLLLLEKVRGRPLGKRADQVITNIGLSMIMLLAVMVTYNDIVRMFGDKIARFFAR